ncbi:MAG: epimerase, partial [Anaerolineae bacterium]
FAELVRLIANKICSKARIVHLRPEHAFFLSRLVGYMVKDVILTRDEVEGLMADLLVPGGPSTGKMRLSDWLEQNADTVGTQYYPSGLKRHY